MDTRPTIEVIPVRNLDNTYTLTVDYFVLNELKKSLQVLNRVRDSRTKSYRRIHGISKPKTLLPAIRIVTTSETERAPMDRLVIDVVAVQNPDDTYTLTVDPYILYEMMDGLKTAESKRDYNRLYYRQHRGRGNKPRAMVPSILIVEPATIEVPFPSAFELPAASK